MKCRIACPADLSALLALESQSFPGDRISPRQMKRFIKSPHSLMLVMDGQESLSGYCLVLFNRGSLLARLYSLAVSPACRGQGIARILLADAEQMAIDRGYVTIRLEVREDNLAAINLYQQQGYKPLTTLVHYYDDLADGIRLQKRLGAPPPSRLLPLPLYVQTTPFTCGAACLLMAFSSLQPGYPMSRIEEIQLWREATTVYMASGHGGCSGRGLALAAHQRGFNVSLWSKAEGIPFIRSVRDPDKKALIELVHNYFDTRLQQAGVPLQEAHPTQAQLETWLTEGACVLLLISTYRFNGCKEPHWILLSGMSEHFFYFHDPLVEKPGDSVASAHVPVSKAALMQIIGFGSQKLTSCVVLHPRLLL
ncbi:GNAT family N-acetyltransferase/peptidase C39 family protein [Shewanella sp. GXUN23E]|uniref:GNAT family N-acetyltransferase/peptidase C39 family protein n=1 Tax=Shewanella sp. GXUN23E TaxID=3422498 RepID=UPI003D7DFFB5